jgi:transposase
LLKKARVRRVLAFDEGRFGLKAWFRRRWCPLGVRPPWIVEDQYEWTWVYVAVEPTTGWSYVLLLPETTSQCLDIFCRGLRQAAGPQRVGVVLDGSGSHRSRQFDWPDDLVPLYLPAYSPELNPAEQLFRHLRKQLANRLFGSRKELEAALSKELRHWQDNRAGIQQLMGYPWWNKGASILSSIR